MTPTALAAPLALPCGAVLANRIAKAAMSEGYADAAGRPTPRLEALYRRWAHSGAGLLLSGNIQVDPTHLERPLNVVVSEASGSAALARMAAAGASGGMHFWAQISHTGRQVDAKINAAPLSASDVEIDVMRGVGFDFARPRAMTEDEIRAAIDQFAFTAKMVKAAGFTGVQLHAAHGYLLSQSLSPFFNRRADEFGGPIENRMKILLAVYRAVRSAVGAKFPVLIKINSRDYLEHGLVPEETALVCRALQDAGIDLVELSGGTMASDPRFSPIRAGRFDAPEREAWFRADAAVIKAALTVPVALVGGVRTPQTALALIKEGVCEMIALSRPLIREPGLIARWQNGDLRPATCLSDNLCLTEARSGNGLRCMHEERE